MSQSESDRRRALAQRVADAHRSLAAADELLAFVSGSVVEDMADARSDVGELLDRVEAQLPQVDTSAIRRRRADFQPV